VGVKVNKHWPYIIPAGVAVAVVGAAYTIGEKDGSSDRDIASLERRIELTDEEIDRLQGRVEGMKEEQNELESELALLRYQLRRLEKEHRERGP
jgi:predicted RNase H-like nuclease (RuvC/YqgF family)